jgi:hypothetical protein
MLPAVVGVTLNVRVVPALLRLRALTVPLVAVTVGVVVSVTFSEKVTVNGMAAVEFTVPPEVTAVLVILVTVGAVPSTVKVL